jgi:hypothetical protein
MPEPPPPVAVHFRQEVVMNALAMMTTAVVLLALAAIGGLVMAMLRFHGAERPPTVFLMGHGVLAAAALTLLIYAAATVGLPPIAMLATAILVVVAGVGAALNLMYHSKMLPIPKAPIVVHGVVAVAGFVLLVMAVLGAPPATALAP